MLLIAICVMFSTMGLAHAVEPEPGHRLVGRWDLRIDAGGEIYRGRLILDDSKGRLGGIYESDEGRRTRIERVERRGNQLRFETRTQRFSVPVTAIFIADVEGHRMSGECDISSGSDSVSYTFSGKRDDLVKLVKASSSAEDPDSSSPILHQFSFQQDVGGYDHATDVEVWAIAPDQTLDLQGTLTSDGNNGGGESQVLMRFDRIIGDAAYQVPRGARVTNATLTVVAFDPGTTVYVHRVLVPWTAAATWNRLSDGLSVDDREASRVRDGFTFGQINMDRQFVQFDVTQTVQAWIDGATNHGWLFVNTGSNGWDFYSSDWHETELRPRLDVECVTSASASDRDAESLKPVDRSSDTAKPNVE